jgi:hypothetical protein
MRTVYPVLMVWVLAWVPACGSSESFNAILPDAQVETDAHVGPRPDAPLGTDASPDTSAPPAETGQDAPSGELTIVPRTEQSFAATVGQQSSAITLAVVNAGTVAAGPLAITITGPDAADFKATASGCDAIAPGNACTISVVFIASVAAAAPKTASLNVTDAGPGGATASVPLRGIAYAACSCGIWPASGDLGSVAVGATGTPVAFTVTNSGDSPSAPLVVSVSNSEFVIVSDTCTGGSLAPMGGSCSVGIALRPASVGAKSATLSITEVNGISVVKMLTGMGVAASLDASPPPPVDGGAPIDQSIDSPSAAGAAIDGPVGSDGDTARPEVTQPGQFVVSPVAIDLGNLPVGTAAPRQTITVTATSTVTDLTVLASGVDVSIAPTSTCTTVLAAGASCTVAVDFVAQTAGVKSDSIVISGGGMTKIVPITAVAQSPAKLVISPSSPQSFAAPVGQTSSAITFGVANTGDVATGPLIVFIMGANAADFTATTSCLILAPLASCTVSVAFKPQAPSGSTEVATLSVTDTAVGGSGVLASLSGIAY